MKTATLTGVPALERSVPSAMGLAWWSKLRAVLRRAWEKLVPLGYEDESGFHFGAHPADQRAGRSIR